MAGQVSRQGEGLSVTILEASLRAVDELGGSGRSTYFRIVSLSHQAPRRSSWNRSYWVKDHESARRRRFERPESEWVRQQDEAWRIVSDELWEAAQATRGRRNERRDGRGRIQRTSIGGASSRKRLLSGFLQCGECGGSFHELTQRRWGCSWHRR
jgi:hypothetical protein